MNEIKNFSKCELNQVYNVNNRELIITQVSTHKNGHYLYTGMIDGEVFTEQNSPQLKKLLGVETIKYDREGGNGGGGTPRMGKEITEESIEKASAAIRCKFDKLMVELSSIVTEETYSEMYRLGCADVIRKADAVREELTNKMMEQQAAKLAKQQKMQESAEIEAYKERCAKLGTTYKNIKSMADMMGVSVADMLNNMEGMRK